MPPDEQASALHAVPSAGTDVTAQAPAPSHAPAPTQVLELAQLVPAAKGVWMSPPAGEQRSAVHGLPSSTVGATPAVQTPAPLQVSAPLQALPSLQLAPATSGVCTTPLAGRQESAVHGLPSSTVGGAPARQVPAALQVSAPLQALPSAQLAPAARRVWTTPLAGKQESAVHGLPSLMTDAASGACRQVPELHVSVVQRLESSQLLGEQMSTAKPD